MITEQRYIIKRTSDGKYLGFATWVNNVREAIHFYSEEQANGDRRIDGLTA